jgi:uncharacterized protein (TIGR00369 family)
MQVENNNNCFACGKQNPIGLQLDIQTMEDNIVYTECIPPAHFQGWAGVIHGGILSTLLDEIITYVAIAHFGGPAVTAQLEIRFKKPVPVGSKLFITGKPITTSKRLVQATAQIQLENGTLVVEATGKCLRAEPVF